MGEYERVYGAHCIGMGRQTARKNHLKGWWAAAHTDGILLYPSVWLDGELIEKEGEYVHPELVKLAKELK